MIDKMDYKNLKNIYEEILKKCSRGELLLAYEDVEEYIPLDWERDDDALRIKAGMACLVVDSTTICIFVYASIAGGVVMPS